MLSTLELLQKYDVPGPRYTSYPTVPAWTETIQSASYKDSLKKVLGDEPLSLYLHLPFCERLCHFCGCFKIITKDHSKSLPYVKLLIEEIKTVAQALKNSNKIVSQIHLGGGTPNFIAPNELHLLMKALKENFNFLPEAELAIEMHPKTSTQAFCEALKAEGFNRISLGIQSFDEDVQALIHRFQTFDETKAMLQSLTALGFKEFNFDLIYGLPGDTLEKFKNTLDLALGLEPQRFAVYSYAHVPWKSKIQRSFKDEDLPSAFDKLVHFEAALKKMNENDFEQVGMDHFAKKEDPLYQALINKSVHRNFMGYSTKADAHQIGFGISAISFVAGNYYQNTKEMEDYTTQIQNQMYATYRGYELSKEDHLRRDVITELMCHMSLHLKKIETKHNLNFEKHFSKEIQLLQSFVEEGLLEKTADGYQVVNNGRLVLRNMAMVFDAYLDEVRKKSTNPVFSRTV